MIIQQKKKISISNRLPIVSLGSILRPFRLDDAEDLKVYLSDGRRYHFKPGKPISIHQASKIADELATSLDFRMIQLRETSRVIGQIDCLCPVEIRYGWINSKAVILTRKKDGVL